MGQVLSCVEYATVFPFFLIISLLLSVFARIIRWSERIHSFAKSFDRKLPRGLEPLADWEKISNAVIRIVGQNPSSHHLQGTNTYLVGTGKHRLLVDSGEGIAGYHSLLEDVMKKVGCESISAILLTHWHIDHVGGVPKILARFPEAQIYKRTHERVQDFSYLGIKDGQTFHTEGANLTAVYTPGHTEDHCSFILEEDKALICGDMILGCGTAVFDDLYTYMDSLKKVRLLTEEKKLDRIYVGHGPHTETGALEKIESYIKHREEREKQIMSVLRKQRQNSPPMTSFQITRSVYGNISIFLLPSAHFNVEHHLQKLLEEKIVSRFLSYSWSVAPGSMHLD